MLIGQWEKLFGIQVASWMVISLLMAGLVLVMTFSETLDLDQEMVLHQLMAL